MRVIPANFAAGYAAGTGADLLLAVVGQDLRRLYDATPAPMTDEIAGLLARLAPPTTVEAARA